MQRARFCPVGSSIPFHFAVTGKFAWSVFIWFSFERVHAL
jgi:hypothetical protein